MAERIRVFNSRTTIGSRIIINEMNEINNKNNTNNNQNMNNVENKDLYKALLEKDKEIKQLKEELSKFPFKLSEKEKLMSIIIATLNEKINFSCICKNTDKFKNIEDKCYKEYPEFIETKNKFTLYNKEINLNKSLEDNNIKNNDTIILTYI